ncbi:MAG: UDP-N-acetylmuramoyl-L-alanine--D-glutamate ligase [Candidatus Omnitrophota bacterium]
MDVKGKKITVVGLGISGKAAAILLKQKGAEVYATDSSSSDNTKAISEELKRAGISVETGRHTEDFIKGSELVVVSPGVMDSSDALRFADKNSMPVVSEIELASWFCKAPIIAVTGTNGKTTTATLIGLFLKAEGKESVVCGNIGEAFCEKVNDIRSDQIAVVEVSSFQLKRINSFRPKAAVITNITQNHFDWHVDFKEYFDSKKNIYKNQRVEDYTVLNYDDHNLKNLEYETHGQVYFFSRYTNVKGAYFDGKRLVLNKDEENSPVCSIDDVELRGLHNVSNILSACICADIFGVSASAMKKVLLGFKGLKHRFQNIADIDGINYIDDSKSTTVDACKAALLSCRDSVILIAGGRDKGSDFSIIRGLIEKRVKAVILIGEAREKIRRALEGASNIHDARDMDEAVNISHDIAKRGDAVLLSPMCASFDMYKDYKHRGEAFQVAVKKLERKKNSVERIADSV